jgi:hypothetical protein
MEKFVNPSLILIINMNQISKSEAYKSIQIGFPPCIISPFSRQNSLREFYIISLLKFSSSYNYSSIETVGKAPKLKHPKILQ